MVTYASPGCLYQCSELQGRSCIFAKDEGYTLDPGSWDWYVPSDLAKCERAKEHPLGDAVGRGSFPILG